MRPTAWMALLLLPLLPACDRLTLENYGRITMGMPYEEVVRLIGKPDRCDDVMGMRACVWGDETRSAHVSFAAGKVLLFSSSNLD